nr:immunoglobulin heavy chain junction region [Macaca mulatta]
CVKSSPTVATAYEYFEFW